MGLSFISFLITIVFRNSPLRTEYWILGTFYFPSHSLISASSFSTASSSGIFFSTHSLRR